MGFLQRLWRIIKANINSVLQKTEDPEKILEQAVSDMQEDLVKLRQAVAQAIASQKRTERQANQAKNTAEEWKKRAQLALEKGNEELAREALTRRQNYQQTADSLGEQLEQQNQVIDKLKADMRKLESKISEAKNKKDMYIARARSAEATQRVSEFMQGVNTGSSLSAFEQMEEKVTEMEASAEATAEMRQDDIEQQFASLEQGGSVDAELNQMKQQSQSRSQQKERTEAQQAEVDQELEKLRSELKQ
ncbi:PspA/IM30 family protein [Dactylococcopsis salina]|uniref:Phage shock protein A (IM30), suppresses sigma54-dependent transcription n=1 Tax=Dactylococcopsis salina (strain PCC 8305) TaxID=13035 RepID=K9YR60_DACS8|nr:PspA/IM30 family protein [Dactylococcopsis salina]AFZ49421.1 phage shock protein A (IM30), suppresses sigma54-dependent transcription [Dactylococcopsis salina PCC 8305]